MFAVGMFGLFSQLPPSAEKYLNPLMGGQPMHQCLELQGALNGGYFSIALMTVAGIPHPSRSPTPSPLASPPSLVAESAVRSQPTL